MTGLHAGRLAALIDACYPATCRRLREERRAVAWARYRARSWRVARCSGLPRHDEAVGCVIDRLELAAGRRDGQAVDAEEAIPVVFRLN